MLALSELAGRSGRRIRVDVLAVAEAVCRGYMAAIASPWYEIEDMRESGA